MLVVSGFAFRFFEFRGRGRDLLSKRTLRSRFCACAENVAIVGRPCTQLPRFSPFFSFFFFGLRLVNLEPRYKFQRALRPKEEDRRGPTNCHEEGCNEWLLIFCIFLGPKNGKSLLLFCHCARFSICSNCCCAVWPICMPAHHPNPVIMGIAIFLLVLRLINNGLNQCCVKMRIAFALVLR